MTETVALAGEVQAVAPRVGLVAWTQRPYELAVASARTCYAADFVFLGRLSPKGERARVSLLDALPDHREELDELGRPETPHDRRVELVEALQAAVQDPAARDAVAVFADLARQRATSDERIARSIYEAGHHTPFQHPTFVFSLEDVSRNAVESFFHNHTFYNSEQQSQRYVRMREPCVVVPPSVAADAEAKAVYEQAVSQAYAAYHDLRERLVAANERTMGAIGRIKGQTERQVRSEAEKKSQEMARYVVPVCAATRLYHTVSGVVLLRYRRMATVGDCPDEVRQVVEAMVEAVREVDPRFLEAAPAEVLEREAHVERLLLGREADGTGRQAERSPAGTQAVGVVAKPVPTDAAAREDAGTDHVPQDPNGTGSAAAGAPGSTSRLLHATPDAPALVAHVLRETTGSTLGDEELLGLVLDPSRNPIWNDTLNTWDHSPALRALRHVHYTFRKRQSLTAFAQDQRHRMTPGARPLLQHVVRGPRLDAHTPSVIRADPEALQVYQRALDGLWDAIQHLRARGIPDHELTYLLPNATDLVYTQSGDLLSYIHKWRLRLCFNAQKEIFDAALDELRQVQALHPELARWLGPPCSFVAAAQPPELQDDVAACCPEGPRWCGVKVWRSFDAAQGRPKRPY